jgi:sterol desaturase/sphingolipid hydroxylase (fatty acid hydroxylase superfamily)
MQISKSSWHYRFNAWMQESFQSRSRNEIFTTCSYIRTTIFSGIIGFFKLLMSLLGVIFVIWAVVGVVYLPFLIFGSVGEVEPLIVGGVIGWGAIGIVVACIVADKLTPFWQARKERKIALLKQAMLDNKAGICTIIEYKD